jgi:cardiolipin synthase (CMP-forming)
LRRRNGMAGREAQAAPPVHLLKIGPVCQMLAAPRNQRGECLNPLHHTEKRMTIPNYITIFRFLLVPLVLYGIFAGHMALALAGFILAGLSDGIDGFIARRFNQRSELGAYLDPMADKLLLVSIFGVFGYLGQLPLWLVYLVISRDAMIIGAVLLSTIMGNPVKMRPLMVSKANTAMQIVLAGFVLADLAFALDYARTEQYLVWLVALLTGVSAGAYFVTWMRHMAGFAETDGKI